MSYLHNDDGSGDTTTAFKVVRTVTAAVGLTIIFLCVAVFIFALTSTPARPVTTEEACTREFQAEGEDAVKQCKLEAAIKIVTDDMYREKKERDEKMRRVISGE